MTAQSDIGIEKDFTTSKAQTGTTGFHRGWTALVALTRAELQETRDLSLVGVFKWALEPLSYMAIYFVLVGAILDRPRYALPLFLLCALVPWRFFTGTTIESMALLKRYSEIIKNRAFPREVIPLILIASQALTFLIALALFAPLMIYYRVDAWPTILWLPVLIVELIVLSAGPTYLGVVFGLYFPDYREIVRNLIRLGFFASSALVPISEIPGDNLPLVLEANPMTGIFDSFRAIMLFEHAPSFRDIAYPSTVGVVLLLVSLAIYRRYQSEFPKET